MFKKIQQKENLIIIFLLLLALILIFYWLSNGSKIIKSLKISQVSQPVDIQTENFAQTIVQKCQKNNPNNCYPVELGKLTESNDFNSVLKTLNQVEELDPTTRGCHLI